MDRDHLTRLIDDPARVQRDDIADLKAMAERYPWFSGAHLLLAVGGHREGDVLFDEQLRASAAHLPSRAVLFDQLQTPRPAAASPVAPPPATTPEARTIVIVPEQRPVPHEGHVRHNDTGSTPASVPESAEHRPMEPIASAEEPGENVHSTEGSPEALPPAAVEERAPVAASPIPPEPPPSEDLRTPWKERLLLEDRDEVELDRQMRDSAVAISYELLLEREGLLRPSPSENTSSTTATAPPAHPPRETPPSPAPPAPAPVRARSFSDWLSEAGTAAAAPQRSPMAKPVEDPEILRALQQLPPIEPKHAPETADTKALVERFIQQNAQQPGVAKKAEFFNPQTAAKRSLEEHADLVTETLAKIYEKQGNIAKAIAAYERLAVKHPEKSAHFRALAKALSGR